MLRPRPVNSGFTMIELLTTILIIAALIAGALVCVVSYATWAKNTADKQTLTILNDALTRYKCEGGALTALTQNAPIGHVLTKLASTISWAGMSHQVMQKGVTYPARSLTAIGNGANYQFTKFNSYQAAFDSSVAILGALSAQGTPSAATPAWVASSLATTGNAPYLVLSQPSSSLLIGMYLRGSGTLCVNWGDGNTNNYTLSGSNTAVTHTYGSAATYGVTLIGNVTYFDSEEQAPLGGIGSAAFGGDISTMTTLTYLLVLGTNTLSGSITNMTGLTYLSAYGYNTLSGSVTNLTGLTYLTVWGSNTLSGSVANLTGLTYLIVTGSNTLSGSVANLTGLTYFYALGSNTLSGSVANLTGLTLFYVTGSNTLTGSVAGLTNLQYLNIQGTNTITGWETVAANATGLSYFYQRGTVLTSAQVNAVLAGFWANRNAAKPRGERVIDVYNSGNGAPTGQGITDKANLQAYKSPNGTGPMVWTVSTN